MLNKNRSSIIKLNYFNELNSEAPFTMLLSSLEKYTTLYLNGFITVGQVSYDTIAEKEFKGQEVNNYSVYYNHINEKTNCLEAVLVQNMTDKYIINHV